MRIIGILLSRPIIFSCVVDSLRTANRLSGEDLYRWALLRPGRRARSPPAGSPCRPGRAEADDLETLIIVAPTCSNSTIPQR